MAHIHSVHIDEKDEVNIKGYGIEIGDYPKSITLLFSTIFARNLFLDKLSLARSIADKKVITDKPQVSIDEVRVWKHGE
jgi:hypothetical protein